jgi:hypothetical protein
VQISNHLHAVQDADVKADRKEASERNFELMNRKARALVAQEHDLREDE